MTRKLTMAQATIQFLKAQYVARDGKEQQFFAGCLGIFGHGNVAGIGEALQQNPDFPYYLFRNEQGMGVDLFIEDRNLTLPDRICRELFQIYRESLHNVKKHANASHVVVKLGQDEAKVFLVIDDNGRGFSFSGRYTSEELDRLRLGPISIKERTRGVGGTLTVESNPGHGARLTVEIPLS